MSVKGTIKLLARKKAWRATKPRALAELTIKPQLPLILCFLLTGCSTWNQFWEERNFNQKVQIEHLDELDSQGLYGPADGLRSLSYEFCIPGDLEHTDKVMKIDPSIVIYPGSPGRIGCTKQQYLCIGNTWQKDYRQTLEALAQQPFIDKIQETYFE